MSVREDGTAGSETCCVNSRPWNVPATVYMPAGRFLKMYAPQVSVLFVKEVPFSVTVSPGTGSCLRALRSYTVAYPEMLR